MKVTSSAVAAASPPTAAPAPQRTATKPTPAAAPAVAPPPAAASRSAASTILSGFEGPIKRPRASLSYKLAAIIVAMLMLLLPLAYLSLIALAGFGVYFHAVNDVGMLQVESVRGKAALYVFLAYLAPIIAGAILVVFMIKPLFARPANHFRTRSLRRESEPLLFAFVDKICEAVGAPRPKRIDVDCQVNASAGFRRGVLSMLGNDMVLTIGLPLMAGMNSRQLAGVLAHEFGHFSQGFGMRLSYLIRSLNHWFMRVVYERDSTDQRLSELAEQLDVRLSWVLYLAMGFVWLSRRILWALMRVGEFFSFRLMRQMEFDADRYEIRLVGSKAFGDTFRQLQLLGAASQAAAGDLRDSYREGRLGDDLSRLIVARADGFPDSVRKALEQSVAAAETRWFHTHPSDGERIAAAERENAPGVFRVQVPASSLLSDFPAQSRAATTEFYRDIFGSALANAQIRPVEELIAATEATRQGDESVDRFSLECSNLLKPPTFAYHEFVERPCPVTVLEELKQVRERMVAESPAIREISHSMFAAFDRLREARVFATLLRSKAGVNDQALKERGGAAGIKKMGDESSRALEAGRVAIESFNQLVARRLELGLQLLGDPDLLEKTPQPKADLAELERLYDAMRRLAEHLVMLADASTQHAGLDALISAIHAGVQREEMGPVLKDLGSALYQVAKRMKESLKSLDYPFPNAKGRMSLGVYCIPETPIDGDLGSVYACMSQATETMPRLYLRTLGILVQAVEAGEKAAGLEPLECPQAT